MNNEYDLVIVGGGPAGLTAGLYASRARINCILLEKIIPGGQIIYTHWIENWPGDVNGVSGIELANRMTNHATKFGLKIKNIEVINLRTLKNNKYLITSQGEIKTKTIILALGASPRKLNIPGETLLTGKGVSYCGTCDAPFFREKKIIVVGGGDTAVEETNFLTKFASKIFLIHRRDKLTSSKILYERIINNPKIEILWSHIILAIEGKDKVESVYIKNLKTDKKYHLLTDGIFIFIGSIPNTSYLKDTIILNKNGFIISNQNLETNIPGIFAIGDCRVSSAKQIVIAAGEGALAISNVQHYLSNTD